MAMQKPLGAALELLTQRSSRSFTYRSISMEKTSKKITGVWQDDPAHFKPVSRRNFLTVGALAGLGSLTLPNLLRLQEARAEQKNYAHFKGTASSIIHIYLPGGMAHQESSDPKPYP